MKLNIKYMKSTVIFLIILFCMNLILICTTNVNQQIHVAAYPRIELLSVIFMLADNPEYQMERIPSYNKDVKIYFDKHKNHPVVEFARQLRETNGIGFDAPMDMAIHITDVVQCKEKVPFDYYIEKVVDRWTSTNARCIDLAKRNAKILAC